MGNMIVNLGLVCLLFVIIPELYSANFVLTNFLPNVFFKIPISLIPSQGAD